MIARAFLVLSVILFTQIASAHAVLLSSKPKAQSTNDGPAIAIELHFNTRIDGKRSRMLLVNPAGKLNPLSVGGQPSPDTLTAAASDLKSGQYKIRWQVLAADGHITRGEIPFRIK